MDLHTGSIEVWDDACRHAACAALVKRNIPHRVFARGSWWRIAVEAITAEHYDEVIDALTAIGEPGVDWNFTLE